jgi:(E)-4-hydroxy-3-methylbut-2-enyl-diphosphate synthase
MIDRRRTSQIHIGNVGIGSDYPVSVQSMTNTDTRDVVATVSQIKLLEDAGCDLVRLAIPDEEAAIALKKILQSVSIPVIADIHFNYKLALIAIESGIHALRLNPGNIGSEENIKKVVNAAKKSSLPIRIGVNSGSIEKEFQEMREVEGMIASAKKHIAILEKYDFNQIKISLKSSSVLTTIEAYRALSSMVAYPLHLGVTEAGTLKRGTIKSSVGIGTLLAEGIGDTVRVSLTENPVEEIAVGIEILKSLELRQQGLNLISCPTCGRTEIDIIGLTKAVEEKLQNLKKPITVAIMGCVVNGPGEARHADIGIAGGKDRAVLFKKGEIIKTVTNNEVLEVLLREIDSML